MILRSSSLLSLVSAIICLGLSQPLAAEARSPWDMQHPTLPAQQPPAGFQPGQAPGTLHTGVPPQFSQTSSMQPSSMQPNQLPKNFWQGGKQSGFANRIQPGVVLTGVMEDEISSAKNKPGDIFAINLKEGYVENGMQVIPRESRIVGAITHVVPAKSQRAPGQPGSLQVSIQSLVLPDGNHLPFAGFIAINPNHAFEKQQKKNLGFDIKDTGSHIAGMMGSFTNGIGFMYARKYRGRDFYMDKDDTIPVKLNKSLIIPEEYVKPVGAAADAPGINGLTPDAKGMSNALPPLAPGMVPGLSGPDTVGQFQAPKPQQPIPGLVGGEADPFITPINSSATGSKPLNDMPEPF